MLAARSIAQLHYRNSRALPTHLNALAILVPQKRTYATETTSSSTSSGSGTPFPPPGFDANKAKQPLSSTETRKSAGQNASNESSSSNAQQAAASQDKNATVSVKVGAEDKRALEKKEEPKKMTIGQKIKHEIQHYWDGTKLLATEARISVKLAMKMAAGYELSRRENRQVSYHLRFLHFLSSGLF